MNKVVNINLNGFIFTIDEGAYDKLRNYIDGLRSHFAGHQGTDEIISDIETRIAELLQQKITDKYSVVQLQNVEDVMVQMGNPNEIDEDENASQKTQQQFTQSDSPKRLRRDSRNEVIGGVCSGIANYFEVDVMIPRAIFLVSFFVFGSGLLIYVLLWVAMPKASPVELSDMSNKNIRRLFRNPNEKMLGGVGSGIGAYLGVDAVWIRIAFLAAFFVFGSGLLLYLILWIAIPEAKTATEKLQMKGEAVDVSNIERKVREAFEGSNEYVKTKAATAAKGMATGVNALGEVLASLLKLLGRLLGFVLVTIGIACTIAFVFLFFNHTELMEFKQIVQTFTGSGLIYKMVVWGTVCLVLSILISLLGVGVKLLFKLSYKIKLLAVFSGVAGFVGIVMLIYACGSYGYSVKDDDTVSDSTLTAVCADTLYLTTDKSLDTLKQSIIRITDSGDENILNFAKVKNGLWISANSLTIKPSKTDSLSLQILKTANASNEADAHEFAKAINYKVSLQGSSIVFASQLFVEGDKYRFERVNTKLRVPVGTIIKTDKAVFEMINRSNFHDDEFEYGETFIMTQEGLKCLDCHESWNDDNEDDYIEINLGKTTEETKEADENGIHIRIGGKEKEDVEVLTQKDGTVSTTKVKKVGPVTVTTKENE